MPETSVTLLTKPGCHLCDDARVVVLDVLARLSYTASVRGEISFAELSILDDPALLAEYIEEIPVVLINGRVHNQWRIDPERLQAALIAAAN
ncbi:MAG: glutaredoxin family protein [Microbacteriaceae bacterium]|nr:glutaredoxin family protein [Microbacteriaceae bacterium]